MEEGGAVVRKIDDLMVEGASDKFRRQLAVQMWAVGIFGLIGLGLAAWRVFA